MNAYPMKILSLFIGLVASPAFSQEHLEPERSTFSGNAYLDSYHRVVVNAFAEAFERNVVARAVIMPSFSPEHAIGMKEDFGVYKVFTLMPDKSYWVNDSTEIKITRCEREIDMDIATSMFSAWEAVLLETRYEKSDRAGLDGVTYHFAVRSGTQVLAGETWSPRSEGPPLKLAQLANSMSAWCEDPTAQNLETLKSSTSAVWDVL